MNIDPRIIDNGHVFAAREPEPAPAWLNWACAALMVGIWAITFLAIWGL